MSHTKIESSVQELIRLVEQGKPTEAFEKFYHDDVVVIEKLTGARTGKAANGKHLEWFGSQITALRHYRSTGYIAGDTASAITWYVDLDHQAWGKIESTEIALQEWQDGKIIRETFYY